MTSTSPSAAATEDARNRALLFFMDHLMTKTGSRTIHDLSCQFGARGFSEEMREAVGGTQETLTSFLQSFPSLFSIEGDEVSINQYGQMGGAPPPTVAKARDYEQEAVDFFINKLKKFGPEMQIKSLLGHRSQAAVECRMVSGRHLKDFVDFLCLHIEAFVVVGDRVRLAVMPEPDDPALLLDEDGEPLVGQKAKIAAVLYLKAHLEGLEDNPVGLDALYGVFCDRFPHVVRQDVATNPKELLAFLKLNRQVFFIRSNKVSLVRARPEGMSPPSSGGLSSSDTDGSIMSPQHTMNALNAINGNYAAPPPQITTVKALKQAQISLQELLHDNLYTANGRQVVAFDCKFVSLGPSTPDFLSLLVLGTPAGKFVIFDAAHSDSIVLESGLKNLLQSDKITKVMHDCSSAAEMFKQRYNITLTNVFDTQIAHQVYQHVRHGRSLTDGRPISFTNLQRMHNPHGLLVTQNNTRVQVNWAHRPIGDDSLSYICEHAVALVPVLYNTLYNALTPEVMPLFNKMCAQRCALEEMTANELGNVHIRAPPPIVQPTGNSNGNTANSPYRPPHMVTRMSAANVNGNGMLAKPACCSCQCHPSSPTTVTKSTEVATQTISTGDITVTNVIY